MKKFIKELFNLKKENRENSKKLINKPFDFSNSVTGAASELFESYLIALGFQEVDIIYLNESSPHLENCYFHCGLREYFCIVADQNTVDLVSQFNKNIIRLYKTNATKEQLDMRERHRDNLMGSGYFQGYIG